MRILYLTDQIYLHGGIEKVLSQKANYLADVSGYEVFIVTHNQGKKNPVYHFSAKIRMIDLNINYEAGRSFFHPTNFKKMPKHCAALKNIFKELNPDVVISCSFGPDFYFIPSLEKSIPKIKEFHSSRYFYHQNYSSVKDRLLKKLTGRTEGKYDQLVVLSDSESAFYNGNKISVIPNPAEISGEKANLMSNRILAAGRISPVKNFGDLIESFAMVAKDFPEWELHFFGEDYLGTQGTLERKIIELGLQNQIKFKGITSNLKKEMKNYSIYAMTSETECFPMVLLEALSVGIPVISYDAPTGPKHILRNEEDSFLIPYKNLDIFTEKLKQLMRDENLRMQMSEKGMTNVRRFSIEKIMQQWIDLFHSLKKN